MLGLIWIPLFNTQMVFMKEFFCDRKKNLADEITHKVASIQSWTDFFLIREAIFMFVECGNVSGQI